MVKSKTESGGRSTSGSFGLKQKIAMLNTQYLQIENQHL